MDWVKKFQAMRALDKFNTCLHIRDDNSWYVHQSGVERKEGGFLSSGSGNGRDPEEAVIQRWNWLTDPKYCIVINASGPKRRAVKWNGFMWEEIEETWKRES